MGRTGSMARLAPCESGRSRKLGKGNKKPDVVRRVLQKLNWSKVVQADRRNGCGVSFHVLM